MHRDDLTGILILLFFCLIGFFTLILPELSYSEPPDISQFIVRDITGERVTVQPVISPTFSFLAEKGAKVEKGDVLACKAAPVTISSASVNRGGQKIPVVLTELDCKKNGKFLVEKVYF